jgi:xanthine dehydrogenase accessory factor
MEKFIVLIKGAGEMASGIAHRLAVCGFSIVMTEIPFPLVIRRGVSYAQAVFDKEYTVEGIPARLAKKENLAAILEKSKIAVIIDTVSQVQAFLKPDIFIDATLSKKNTSIQITDAPLVMGIGPGFYAGKDVHFCIETQRGHSLGRVISEGSAIPDTGIPGDIGGYTWERVLRSPGDGIFHTEKKIGDIVEKNSIIGYIENLEVYASISGVLRGLIYPGCLCQKNWKIGDIDPRGIQEYCWQISDKARTISGSVLECILQRYPLCKDSG